jgi:diaminopimelate decarboxylase
MLFHGTQRINDAGHLEVGGCDTVDLASQFGTPLYVIDEATLRQKCRDYRAAFEKRYAKNVFCYASKALLNLAVAKVIEQEGFQIDVASGGELFVALQAGFPASKINLHGNNKSIIELRMAVENHVGHVVIDHIDEVDQLAEEATRAGIVQSVLVRATPGVDPHTHAYISTGQADSKFGLNIGDGSALAAIKCVLGQPSLKFDGIHCHVGSQLLDTEAHEGAMEAMVGLIADVKRETGVDCAVLNLGGGLGIRYLESHQPPTMDEYAERIVNALRKTLAKFGLEEPILQHEPGRAIAGEAGMTLYTVGVVKTVPVTEDPGTRTYVAVDGGLSDNPRPQLYDAVYTVLNASRTSEPHDKPVRIAGKHCETDTLVPKTFLPTVEPGDVVAVLGTGAYNAGMASNYNRFLRPAVVLVNDGQADLVVEREVYEDLVKHELLPTRLAAS